MQTDLFHSFHFTFDEVQPRPEEIQSFLKSENTDAGYPVNEAILTILPLLSDNANIEGGYILRNVRKVHFDTGAQIASYMKGADYLALFACTAGAVFTDLAHRYNQAGDYLEAFVTDAIGSLTVEKAMDKIQTQLESNMQAQGLQISNRYSPGYCNWPVSGQRELFDQMGEIPIAVSLTESCLMLPIKSVSGIIGVGANIRKRPYACRICKNKNCIHRKLIQ
ncbi:MAG: hypothetical protein LBH19_06235 [Dysgonamonadaceae bacterium]|jgi:hypothetical protein|nr:hypothetical protein [Dysgonamonadaceae bacterium]